MTADLFRCRTGKSTTDPCQRCGATIPPFTLAWQETGLDGLTCPECAARAVRLSEGPDARKVPQAGAERTDGATYEEWLDEHRDHKGLYALLRDLFGT